MEKLLRTWSLSIVTRISKKLFRILRKERLISKMLVVPTTVHMACKVEEFQLKILKAI